MSHDINPYLPTQQTFEMQSFGIEGNIIDHSWYHIIKKINGKTDSLAILILADVFYWYRPSVVKNEITGEVRIYKKFKSDILQKDYESMQDQFGATQEQAREALKTLERLGICERETRVVMMGGRKVPNILFIRLNHLKLKELQDKYYREKASNQGVGWEISHPTVGNFPPLDGKFPTNTKNTTETSSKKQQQAKPKEKPSAVVVFFDILKDLDIKDSQKEWLSKNYDEATVINAVSYALNPNVKIRESLIQTIKWACKEKPQIPQSKEDKEKSNRELAIDIEKAAQVPAGCTLHVMNTCIEISLGGNTTPFLLEYSENGFKEKLKQAFKKYGIKPK